MLSRQLFIRSSVPSRTFASTLVLKVLNPYSGKVYANVPLMKRSKILELVGKAANSQKQWKETSLNERIKVVEKWITAMETKKEDLAKDITNQMGKPLKQAMGEVMTAIDRAKKMIQSAPKALEDISISEAKGDSDLFRKIEREPVGVVLVLTPWNYPLICAVNAVIPAILAGNSVLIKHSDKTPLCANHFEDTFKTASENKYSNLVQALHITHAQVPTVIENSSISYVAFTGSVEGGKAVYRSVAKSRFIDVGLELGGKDPAYVAADADANSAAESLVDGAMYNAGQSCCSIERAYVHSSLYTKFLDKAVTVASQYVLGDPLNAETTMGPLANYRHARFLEAQVEDAVAKGAKVLLGGKRVVQGKATFFAPTVLSNVNNSMSIMREESFGPILPVMSVNSDAEAIDLMNDSPYGLTASIYSKDVSLCQKLAKKINAGTVFMNRCDYVDPQLPWSGRGDSGKGITLSQLGFGAFTRTKGYNFRVPKL